MLKSDYIRAEHEKMLLKLGYVCVCNKSDVQTWVDVQNSGHDIFHLVHNYPLFVDELECLSSRDAEQMGAIYFVVKYADRTGAHESTSVERAVAVSRGSYSSLPM